LDYKGFQARRQQLILSGTEVVKFIDSCHNAYIGSDASMFDKSVLKSIHDGQNYGCRLKFVSMVTYRQRNMLICAMLVEIEVEAKK
jgi:hypothetical protein